MANAHHLVHLVHHVAKELLDRANLGPPVYDWRIGTIMRVVKDLQMSCWTQQCATEIYCSLSCMPITLSQLLKFAS